MTVSLPPRQSRQQQSDIIERQVSPTVRHPILGLASTENCRSLGADGWCNLVRTVQTPGMPSHRDQFVPRGGKPLALSRRLSEFADADGVEKSPPRYVPWERADAPVAMTKPHERRLSGNPTPGCTSPGDTRSPRQRSDHRPGKPRAASASVCRNFSAN